MAAHIEWSSDNILVVKFSDQITWDEFHAAIRQMHGMIAQVNHAVYPVIVQNAPLPAGHPLGHFQTIIKQQPKNTAGVFIVPRPGSPAVASFMKALMSIVERANPTKSKIRLVSSLEEAQQLIARSGAAQSS